MPKVKKSPKFQYGIEITKPHSKEMYDHNDMVNSLMKKNILQKNLFLEAYGFLP